MNSVGIAGWVAHLAFWILLAVGGFSSELGWRGVAASLIFWVGGYFALPHLPNGAAFFAPYVAVLDIAMVIAIFKGDVTVR
jgi:hypothetical protein